MVESVVSDNVTTAVGGRLLDYLPAVLGLFTS